MNKLNTPCHIIDLDKLKLNLIKAYELKKLSNCELLYALKGLSEQFILEYIREYIDGISTGSIGEIDMGKRCGYNNISIYSPAYTDNETVSKICKNSNRIIFNSLNQLNAYRDIAKQYNCKIGLRVNIGFSKIWQQGVNPCIPGSHLGIPISKLKEVWKPDLVDGLLVHSLCEQDDTALEGLIIHTINNLDTQLYQIKWLNLGGGHLIGSDAYNIQNAASHISKLQSKYGIKVVLEPCEGIIVNCGYFATRIVDIIEDDIKVAIMDASPICHMQDAVFRGWTRDIVGESENGIYTYKLSGTSCFAGDTFGSYRFGHSLNVGDIIYFKDTAAYTIVKNMRFNGIQEPSIYTYSKLNGIQLIK